VVIPKGKSITDIDVNPSQAANQNLTDCKNLTLVYSPFAKDLTCYRLYNNSGDYVLALVKGMYGNLLAFI
jgi:hypothetical protein